MCALLDHVRLYMIMQYYTHTYLYISNLIIINIYIYIYLVTPPPRYFFFPWESLKSVRWPFSHGQLESKRFDHHTFHPRSHVIIRCLPLFWHFETQRCHNIHMASKKPRILWKRIQIHPISRWWFQIFVIFIPIWGFMIQFDLRIFFRWVAQPLARFVKIIHSSQLCDRFPRG